MNTIAEERIARHVKKMKVTRSYADMFKLLEMIGNHWHYIAPDFRDAILGALEEKGARESNEGNTWRIRTPQEEIKFELVNGKLREVEITPYNR